MTTLTAKTSAPFLQFIPGRHCYTIEPVSGEKLIMKTKYYHEPAPSVFLNLRFPCRRSMDIPATEIVVLRLNQDIFGPHVVLRKLFDAMTSCLEEICLTEHQIISFVEMEPEFLGEENSRTLFLIHSDKGFSIACAQPRFHFGGEIALVPMDIAEPLYVEKIHLNLVIPRHSTINTLKT